MYADDVQICLKSNPGLVNVGHFILKLNYDFRGIYKWTGKNDLLVNSKIFKCILISDDMVTTYSFTNVCYGSEYFGTVKNRKTSSYFNYSTST